MTLLTSHDIVVAMVATAADRVDAGTAETTGKLVVWAGPIPATIDAAVSPTSKMLIDCNLMNPAFGAPAVLADSVEALAFTLPQTTSLDEGEATFFRIYDRDGDVCFQGEVSDDPDAGAELIVNQANLTPGADVTVERLVIGMPL